VLLQIPVGLGSGMAGQGLPKLAQAYQQLEKPCATIDANTTHTYPQVEEVRVDMAGMKVECRHVELLTSVGSCVAICVYDTLHKCGGLAHIMLPHSSLGLREPLPSKYANTAVPALANAIRGINGSESRLAAKIAGGANMFANTCATSLDIGAKNVKAVKSALTEHRIRLVDEDVGGSHGRRITFDVASSVTTIRLYNGEIKKL
jgi:chemotaxis protein CheD